MLFFLVKKCANTDSRRVDTYKGNENDFAKKFLEVKAEKHSCREQLVKAVSDERMQGFKLQIVKISTQRLQMNVRGSGQDGQSLGFAPVLS